MAANVETSPTRMPHALPVYSSRAVRTRIALEAARAHRVTITGFRALVLLSIMMDPIVRMTVVQSRVALWQIRLNNVNLLRWEVAPVENSLRLSKTMLAAVRFSGGGAGALHIHCLVVGGDSYEPNSTASDIRLFGLSHSRRHCVTEVAWSDKQE